MIWIRCIILLFVIILKLVSTFIPGLTGWADGMMLGILLIFFIESFSEALNLKFGG